MIIGIRCEETRRKLLQTPELTLQKTIAICRTNETAATQMRTMNTESSQIHKVDGRERNQQMRRVPTSQGQRFHHDTRHEWIKDCRYCGKSHPKQKEKCPAFNKTCTKCKKRNHFQVKCRASNLHHVCNETEGHDEHDFYDDDDDDDQYVMKIGEKTPKTMTAQMIVNTKKIQFQLDSGAEINTLCRKYVYTQQITPTTKKLIMWNGTKMTPVGEAELKIKNPKTKETFNVKFIVIDDEYMCLLGLETIRKMDLIAINKHKFIRNVDLVSKEPEANIGDLGQASLKLQQDAKPRILPCRNVPLALKDKVQKELTSLVNRGILKQVEKPTEWVSQMAVVEKQNGLVKICIDPLPLNNALMREHYKLKTLDDVLPLLQNVKVFSKLDVKEAFYHVRLDDVSADLTTMITPFGRYKWNRLPFGLSVSSEIFQRRLNEALEGIPGCINVADDIIIYGCGTNKKEAEEDHDTKMNLLMKHCEGKICLNDEKAQLKQNSIQFLGHIISSEGIQPDPQKVKAVTDMPAPTDIPGVRRFCGVVQYLARYIPNLSQTAEPLRALTKKNNEFLWSEECRCAFQLIKQKVAKATSLSYFDASKPLCLQADSSKDGLGAVLLQDGKPIEFASRALTPTQQKWAQIEKELLAVVIALERFHQYTYGRQIIVENDHKPLGNILNKPLSQAPKRLQNLLMRIYKYDIKFKFVPGSNLILADTFSRAYLKESQEIEEHIVNCTQIRDAVMEDIRTATENDTTFTEMTRYVMDGWPDKQSVRPELKPYFDFRETIVMDNEKGVLLKGERAIIPPKLHAEMRNKLHSSHLGKDSIIRRARTTVFWPGINQEITQMVEACDACQRHKPRNRQEPLQQHEEGDKAWDKIGIDFMEFSNRNYMVIVDYYSNFIEVEHMTSTTTSYTITRLKQQFARYGIPKVIITDCGPQFTSEKFGDFTKSWKIIHSTSSPGYPQSNGKAESAVKIIKQLMKKSLHAQSDPYQGLLEIRNTPRQASDVSPAQLVFRRNTRSFLSTFNSRQPQPDDIKHKRQQRQQSIKRHYDANARALPQLARGQPVFYRPLKEHFWKKGWVKDKHDFRSYDIEGENGGRYIRNRRDINPSSTPTFRQSIHSEIDQYPHGPSYHQNTNRQQQIEPTLTRSTSKHNDEDNHPMRTHSPIRTRAHTASSPTQTNREDPTEGRPNRQKKRPTWLKDFVTTSTE